MLRKNTGLRRRTYGHTQCSSAISNCILERRTGIIDLMYNSPSGMVFQVTRPAPGQFDIARYARQQIMHKLYISLRYFVSEQVGIGMYKHMTLVSNPNQNCVYKSYFFLLCIPSLFSSTKLKNSSFLLLNEILPLFHGLELGYLAMRWVYLVYIAND